MQWITLWLVNSSVGADLPVSSPTWSEAAGWFEASWLSLSEPAADRDGSCKRWEMPTLLLSVSLLPKVKALDSGARAVQPAAAHCCRGGTEPLGKPFTRCKGEPVSPKQLSKDHPPSVCEVMPGAFGGRTAEGDRPQWPLACALSGVPHLPCFHHPQACLPPAPTGRTLPWWVSTSGQPGRRSMAAMLA